MVTPYGVAEPAHSGCEHRFVLDSESKQRCNRCGKAHRSASQALNAANNFTTFNMYMPSGSFNWPLVG